MALKWTLAWACLSLATAEEDAACMLQAHRAVEDTKPFCPAGTKSTFDFLKKKHGDIIKPNSIPKVTITVTPRKNPSSCTGPAMILDTRGPPGANPTPDGDLATCPDCAMLIYSQDGNTNNVNDCGEQSGPRFRFDFLKLEDLETILLWDLDEGTTRIRLYNDDGNMIGNILVPNTANGAGITVNLLTKNVRRMDVLLGGSGGIVSLTGCKQVGGSIFGDPHIYTLDGGKFDLYENGTFSVFHLTGLEPHVPKTAAGPHKGSVDWQLYAHYGGPRWTAQGLLLVDRSMGVFRQSMELTTKDCQWRSKTGKSREWALVQNVTGSLSLLEGGEYVTGFEFLNEKHVNLRMKTEKGYKDSMILNTICKPSGINVRFTMPDMDDARFVEGQIQLGNGKTQKKFPVKQSWSSLGGSKPATSFLQQLQGQKFSLLTSCTQVEKEKAEKICAKHLGENMAHDDETGAEIFADCVFDVCRGGEDFAVATAEMLDA